MYQVSGRPGRRREKIALALKGLVIVGSLVSIIHHNVVAELLPPTYSIHDGAGKTVLVRAYDHVIAAGLRLGLWPKWRMYSPVWKKIFRVQIQARDRTGRWRDVDLPDVSNPHYRANRSVLSAWLWDFKLARIYDDNFAFPSRSIDLMKRYVQYYRPLAERQLGGRVTAFRLRSRTYFIPPASEKGDWTPQTAPVATTSFFRIPE